MPMMIRVMTMTIMITMSMAITMAMAMDHGDADDDDGDDDDDEDADQGDDAARSNISQARHKNATSAFDEPNALQEHEFGVAAYGFRLEFPLGVSAWGF